MLQEDRYRLSWTYCRNQPQSSTVPAAIPREIKQGCLREVPSTSKPPLHYYSIMKAGGHGNMGASHRLYSPVLHRLQPKGSAVGKRVEGGRKRGLWPDGSIALSHSFRRMLWQTKLPPWACSRSLKIRRKHNGTKITSPRHHVLAQTIGAVRTWPWVVP